MNFDPLVDVALAYIPDSKNSSNEQQVYQERTILQDYVNRKKSYQESKIELLKLTNTTQPLDKIKSILDIEDEPIPPSPVMDELSKNTRKKTRTWNNSEDLRLLKAIHIYGLENWNDVAQYVGNGRTRSQCSQRWIRVLDPRISKSNWTKEEENKLIELVMLYGEKSWAKVSTKMGNRSDVQCRYRYQQLPKAKIIQHQKEPEVKKEHALHKNIPKRAVTISLPVHPPTPAPAQKPAVVEEKPIELVEQVADPIIIDDSSVEKEVGLDDSNIMLLNDNMRLDAPLGSSFFDFFKSDQMFESSFWA